jgi:hypothetical protein
MGVKVRDEDTAGAYSMYDNTIPPGSPGPLPERLAISSTPSIPPLLLLRACR